MKKNSAATSKNMKADKASTEDKIKQAARKLFTKNGFAAVKTRDIAAEAGINLALLNYYFRSKKKLFEIIIGKLYIPSIAGISVKLPFKPCMRFSRTRLTGRLSW